MFASKKKEEVLFSNSMIGLFLFVFFQVLKRSRRKLDDKNIENDAVLFSIAFRERPFDDAFISEEKFELIGLRLVACDK